MQIQQEFEYDAYSLFVYAIRSPVTHNYYLQRLQIFCDHINLLHKGTIQERSNFFAQKGTKNPSWAFTT
jgi:hypothetical protein